MIRSPQYIYLVDIDGTIADCSHRLHLIQGTKPDWDAFHALCEEDSPIDSVIHTIQSLAHPSTLIIMATGRMETNREKTVAWMNNLSIPCDGLFMREVGDFRPDYVVKGEMIDSIREIWPEAEIVAAFEDRDQVVEMMRARGIKVFQVAKGTY